MVLSVVIEKDRLNEQSKAPKGKPTKDYVRKNKQIMQNKPNFMRFSPENADFTKKQTQYKANFGPKSRVAKPKQTQFKPNLPLYKGANLLEFIIKKVYTLKKNTNKRTGRDNFD